MSKEMPAPVNPPSEFVIIDVEYESRTTYEQFVSMLVGQQISRLYCLDLNHLSDLPESKNVTRPNSVEEKLVFIRDFVDRLAVQLSDSATKQAKTKSLLKQPIDVEPKTEKTVILLSGFGFGEQLQGKFAEKAAESHSEYVTTVTNFLSDLNAKLAAADECDVSGLEFPEYPEQPQLYEEFSKMQLAHGVCISAYVQLTEDQQAVDQLLRDQPFNEFIQKQPHFFQNAPPGGEKQSPQAGKQQGQQIQLITQPNKEQRFYDMELFQFVANPYRQKQALLKPALFVTKPPPADQKQKKVQRIQREAAAVPYCFADGSVNFQKLCTYLRDARETRVAKFDEVVRLVPCFEISGLSRLQTLQSAFQAVQKQQPKDEKMLVSLFQKEIGDQSYVGQELRRFVIKLNVLLCAPERYKAFYKGAVLLTDREFNDAQSFEGLRHDDFRCISYYNVSKAAASQTPGLRCIEIGGKAAKKPQDERVLVAATQRFANDPLNYLNAIQNKKEETVEQFRAAARLSRQALLIAAAASGEPMRPCGDLKVYNQLLNRLQFEDQNRVGSVLEAMLQQLEADQQQQAPTRRPSTSGHEQKQKKPVEKEPGKTVARTMSGKQMGDDQVSQIKGALFQSQVKDLQLLQNISQYESSVIIDPSLLNTAQRSGFKLQASEINYLVGEHAVSSYMPEDTAREQGVKAIRDFLDAVEVHESTALTGLTERVRTAFENITRVNEERTRAAEQENERRHRLDFIAQYEAYQAKAVEKDREAKIARLKRTKDSKAPEIPPLEPFEYVKSYEEVVPELLETPHQPEQLPDQSRADFIYSLAGGDHLLSVTNAIEPLMAFDDPKNDASERRIYVDSIWSDTRAANIPLLLRRYSEDVGVIFPVAPRFTQWLNCELIKEALRFEDAIEVVLAQQRQSSEMCELSGGLYDFSAPVSGVDPQSVEGVCKNVVLFCPENVESYAQIMTASFGTTGVQCVKPQEVDASLNRFAQIQEEIARSKLEETQPAAEGPAVTAGQPKESTDNKSPVIDRSNSPTQKKLPASPSKEIKEPVPEMRKEARSLAPVFFGSAFKKLHVATLQLPIEDTKKVPLDFSTLQDFDATVPTLAPFVDLRPGDFSTQTAHQQTELGMSFASHQPALASAKHVLLNYQLGPILSSFSATGLEEQDVVQFNGFEGDANASLGGLPDGFQQQNLFKTEKKSRENDSAQQVEYRKRKKRVQDFAELAKQEAAQRKQLVQQRIGQAVKGLRGVDAKLRISLPLDQMAVSYGSSNEERIVISYNNFTLRGGAEGAVTIERHFCNVNPATLQAEGCKEMISALCFALKVNANKLYYRIDFVYSVVSGMISLVAYVQEAPELEPETIELVAVPFDVDHDFQPQVEQQRLIPQTGAVLVTRDRDEFCQTIQRNFAQATASDLLQVDEEVVLPQTIQDSRTLAWQYSSSLCTLSALSAVIQKKNYEDILRHPKDFKEEPYVHNLLESVYNYRQAAKRDPAWVQSRLRQILSAQEFPAHMFILPIGAAGFYDEHGMLTLLLNIGGVTDFLQIKADESIVFSHFDQLQIIAHGDAVELGQLFSPSLVSYQLSRAQFALPGLSGSLGSPATQCSVESPSPLLYLPDIYQVMVPGELLPPSMHHFVASQLLAEKKQDEKNALNTTHPAMPIAAAIHITDAQSLELCFSGPASVLLDACVNSQSEIGGSLLRDFNLALRAVIQNVPLFTTPSIFQEIRVRRWEMRTDCAEVRERFFLDAAEQQDSEEPEPLLDQEFPEFEPDEVIQKQTDQVIVDGGRAIDEQAAREHIRLDIAERNSYGSYWDTPEGREFSIKDKSRYVTKLQEYSNLSRAVLPAAEIFGELPHFSENISKLIKLQNLKKAIPTTLNQRQYPAPCSQKLLTTQEVQQFTTQQFKQSQQQLENQMIQDSVLAKEALACKNADYLRVETTYLRKQKQASVQSEFTRMIHVDPKIISIKVTPEQLLQIYDQQKLARNEKRTKLGLKPLQDEPKKMVRLYNEVRVVNVGSQTVKVRMDKVEGSIVKYMSLQLQRNSGIPAGMTANAVIELELPADLETNIYDVVILKTQEEVVSVPVCIFVKEEVEKPAEEDEKREELMDSPPDCGVACPPTIEEMDEAEQMPGFDQAVDFAESVEEEEQIYPSTFYGRPASQ